MSSDKQYFGEMLDTFVYDVFMNDRRFAAGTKERYEQVHRNYIKPCSLAGCSLEEVKSMDLQQFYNNVDCSNATLRAIHNLMCHFYKYLEKEGYCRNLTSSLVLPKKQDTKAQHEKANPHNIAKIELNNKNTREFEIVETKTSSSIRNMPLSDKVWEEIELHAAWNKKEMLQNGYRTEFLFTTQSGSFYDRQNINRACRRYYKSIGVENKGFHTYRHTFCTNLCKNGVPIQTACKLMGHNNINVTAQFYTNIDDEQKMNAIDKITDIMF